MFYLIIGLYFLPIVLLTIMVECEAFGLATLTVIASAGVVAFLHRYDILPFIHQHWVDVVVYAAAYVAIGIAWSFVRWLVFLVKYNHEFTNAKLKFLRHAELDTTKPIPPDVMSRFVSWCGYRTSEIKMLKFSNGKIVKPLASDSKDKIIAWGCFWPVSAIGFVLNDPFRRLFTFLFGVFSNSYQYLSDKVVSHEEFDYKD